MPTLSAFASLVSGKDLAYTATAAVGSFVLYRVLSAGLASLDLSRVASTTIKICAGTALSVLPLAVLVNRIAPAEDRRVTLKLVKFKLDALRANKNAETAADVWEARVKKSGDRVFICFESQSITYRQMDERANQICYWARDQGLKVGDRVCLMMENRPEFLVVWIGLVKLGVAVALINTNLRGESLVHCIRESGASIFIVGRELLDAVAPIHRQHEEEASRDASKKKLNFFIFCGVSVTPASTSSSSVPLEASGTSDHEILAAEYSMFSLDSAIAKYPTVVGNTREWRKGLETMSSMFLIYTSGTTGLPKAAHFPHLRFLASSSFALMANLKRESVLYCVLPLYHSAAGCIAVSAVMKTGATLVIKRKFSVSAFWRDCIDYKVTHFQYIGEICRYLLKAPPSPLDRAHSVTWCYGNGLRPEVWKDFKERFNIKYVGEFYGATEGNVVLLNYQQRIGAVGYIPRVASPFYPVKIVKFDVTSEEPVRRSDGSCVECEAGETGEMLGRIVKRDPTTQNAAYTNKEATEKKIMRNVFRNGDAWFRTGDLMMKDADGFIYFMDRIGDTFRWKGENVSTNEVTQVLSSNKMFEEVTVYGISLPFCDGKCGLQTTGTFKNMKADLVARGFDLRKADNALIYVRDDAAGTFVPFTPQMQDDLLKGILRF